MYGCLSTGKQVAEVEENFPVINFSENVEQVSVLNLSDAVEWEGGRRWRFTDELLIREISNVQVMSEMI